ncbi:MAG: XdhC family protein, partial [Elusimicrobia bacterium]|nr:XdhC family protein [Elusimicrobiota bacterium]
PHLKEYVLCKEMGQCCGGRVEVFFEIIPRQKQIHLFGGGHVGRAVAQVFSQMSFHLTLIDPRPDWATPEGLPSELHTLLMDPLRYVQSQPWNENDAVCIFTHSHDLDFLLVQYFLKQPLGYLGLIGSQHKADIFLARLKSSSEPDLAEVWEDKMHCPIGIPLDSKNPKIIAVSIAAEVLKEWGLKDSLVSRVESQESTDQVQV